VVTPGGLPRTLVVQELALGLLEAAVEFAFEVVARAAPSVPVNRHGRDELDVGVERTAVTIVAAIAPALAASVPPPTRPGRAAVERL